MSKKYWDGSYLSENKFKMGLNCSCYKKSKTTFHDYSKGCPNPGFSYPLRVQVPQVKNHCSMVLFVLRKYIMSDVWSQLYYFLTFSLLNETGNDGLYSFLHRGNPVYDMIQANNNVWLKNTPTSLPS